MDSKEDFDVAQFEKKLMNIKDTQESIQHMSAWCLQKRSHHKKIVRSWLNVLKQVKIDHRITLFHLANDVIQYSKRKNYEFVESWGTTLQRATTMVRDEKVKHKISRIFNIWKQRDIYNDEFLSDLNGLLSVQSTNKQSAKDKPLKPSDPHTDDDFQAVTLVANIRECVKLETETTKSIKIVAKVPIPDIEELSASLKDRRHFEDVEQEINDHYKKYEECIENLKTEIKARGLLLAALDQAEVFYQNQRGEVKVVANAYRNFGNRIKTMKKKLDELSTSLPSPIPSPDINAPSPEPDNEFVLPDEPSFFANQSNGYMGYMDASLPFDISDFRRESPNSSHTVQPIQVINSRNSAIPDTYSLSQTSNSSMTYTSPISSTLQDFVNTPNVSDYSNTSITSNYGGQPPMQNYHDVAGYSNQNNSLPSYGNSQPDYSASSVAPLLPPPMPPSLDRSNDYNSTSWNMPWMRSNEDNSFNQSIETPVSPPHFERKGVMNKMIEYIDNTSDVLTEGGQDVDHRQLPNMQIQSLIKDVDHRNLISLTGSPGPTMDKSHETDVTPPPPVPMELWMKVDSMYRGQSDMGMNEKAGGDSDYRIPPPNITSINNQNCDTTLLPPPLPPAALDTPPLLKMDDFMNFDNDINASSHKPQMLHNRMNKNELSPMKNFNTPNTRSPHVKNGRDNIESVDMEMSDEDLEEQQQHYDSLNNSQNMLHNKFPRGQGLLPDPEYPIMNRNKVWGGNNFMERERSAPPTWDHNTSIPPPGFSGNGGPNAPPSGFSSPNRGGFTGPVQKFRGSPIRGRPFFNHNNRGGRGNFRGNNFRNARGGGGQGGGIW